MEEFRGLRGGVEVCEIEGAGHCPHDERGEECRDGVEEWIKRNGIGV
jgi:pimeloyl-ACP methyl ester carboxylesterase